jgi:hypothetical protein
MVNVRRHPLEFGHISVSVCVCFHKTESLSHSVDYGLYCSFSLLDTQWIKQDLILHCVFVIDAICEDIGSNLAELVHF